MRSFDTLLFSWSCAVTSETWMLHSRPAATHYTTTATLGAGTQCNKSDGRSKVPPDMGVAEFGGNAAACSSRVLPADECSIAVRRPVQSHRGGREIQLLMVWARSRTKTNSVRMEAWKRSEESRNLVLVSFPFHSMCVGVLASTVLGPLGELDSTQLLPLEFVSRFTCAFRLLATPPIIGYSRQEPAKYVL